MFPVLKALRNTIIYHLGSVALGAFIIAIIQFVRVSKMACSSFAGCAVHVWQAYLVAVVGASLLPSRDLVRGSHQVRRPSERLSPGCLSQLEACHRKPMHCHRKPMSAPCGAATSCSGSSAT